jgi:hypothetical protein
MILSGATTLQPRSAAEWVALMAAIFCGVLSLLLLLAIPLKFPLLRLNQKQQYLRGPIHAMTSATLALMGDGLPQVLGAVGLHVDLACRCRPCLLRGLVCNGPGGAAEAASSVIAM